MTEEPTTNGHGEALERFRTRQRRRVRFVWLSVAALLLVGVFWFGFTAVSAVSRITDTSDTRSPILQLIGKTLDQNALAGEGDGRINILLIGIGGAGHKGGTLADTIMVASLDPDNHKLALLSLPRDLRVPIAGNGTNKINAAHSYGETQAKGNGPKVLKQTVTNILDLPIHYYLQADFTGFTKLIDAVGGVTIDVPKALNDPLYPDEQLIGYKPLYIPAGRQTMSGALALKYARSRQTTSDFDRASRQQQILVAFKQQALSLGVVGNPKKVTNIISILGDHVRTDLNLVELQRLFTIVKDVDSGQVITKILDNSPDGPLQSISEGGYYLVPKAGDFSEVRRIAYELFTDPNLIREKAAIEILNGTGTAGTARELELDLRSLGYTIVSIDRVDTTPTTMIQDFSGGKAPFTSRFLSERLSAAVKTMERPESAKGVDVRITLGSDFALKEVAP